MIIHAGNFIKLPVITQDGQYVGKIEKIVFSSEQSLMLGFFVKTRDFLSKIKVISTQDILVYHRKMIILNSIDSLVEINEIVRIEQEIKKGLKIIGANALTESGKNIGKVYDLLIDTDSGMILKFYTTSIFGQRIIPTEKVIEINKKGVIFSDDIEVKIASQEMAMI